jgi:hypothetical protein
MSGGLKKRRRSKTLLDQRRGRSTPATRSVRSPLQVTADLAASWLDVGPQVGQWSGAGRKKDATFFSGCSALRPRRAPVSSSQRRRNRVHFSGERKQGRARGRERTASLARGMNPRGGMCRYEIGGF